MDAEEVAAFEKAEEGIPKEQWAKGSNAKKITSKNNDKIFFIIFFYQKQNKLASKYFYLLAYFVSDTLVYLQ